SPPGPTELEPTKSETFTCEHTLTEADAKANGDKYENSGSITGNGVTHESNKVVVFVENPKFTIEKEQKIAGEASFTKSELTAEVGKTVDYQLKVTNTGNVKQKFGALVDANCTNISPSGTTELEPTKSETFTCEHALSQADSEANGGKYENSGSITGNGVTHESNKVVVNVVFKNFTIVKEQRIEGE